MTGVTSSVLRPSMHLDNKRKNTLWQPNISILNDLSCKDFAKKEIKECLDNNNNGAVTPRILWDAAESVISGKLIQ